MLVRIILAFSAILLLTLTGGAQDCPIKEFTQEAREQLLRQAPTCDKAMELFGVCSYGASGDTSLGQIVTEKRQEVFLQKLSAAQRRTYDREMKRCGDKYKNQDGAMYRSFAASCRASLAQSYARASLSRRGRVSARIRLQAASAALAFSTIAWNVAGSRMARSDSTLRSTVTPALSRPLMNRL